jgi:cellulose 1,4-beta-cellobiosidase
MFPYATLSALVTLAAVVSGQQVGTSQAETHPKLTSQRCTASGCTTQSTSIVIDANWRWLHSVGGYSNCYNGNTWDANLCPDGKACAANCALEGADYQGTYGITTSGRNLHDFCSNQVY